MEGIIKIQKLGEDGKMRVLVINEKEHFIGGLFYAKDFQQKNIQIIDTTNMSAQDFLNWGEEK